MGGKPIEKRDILSYTKDGLTTSKCVIEDGGYAKLGNLVIVNLRIKFTETTSTGAMTIMSGLPQSITNTNNVAFSNNRTNDVVNTQLNGTSLQLGLANSIAANQLLFVSGAYLCR